MKLLQVAIVLYIAMLKGMGDARYPARVEQSPITVDLTGALTVDGLKLKELGFKKLGGYGVGFESFHTSNRKITWIFPNQVRIEQRMTLSFIGFREEGSVLVQSTGEMMPLEEITPIIYRLHDILNLSHEKYDEWLQSDGIKGMNGINFTWGNRTKNPEISYSVRHSFGQSFPWKITFFAEWIPQSKPEQKREFPFTRQGVISLDPPSGRRYTMEEDNALYAGKYADKNEPFHIFTALIVCLSLWLIFIIGRIVKRWNR